MKSSFTQRLRSRIFRISMLTLILTIVMGGIAFRYADMKHTEHHELELGIFAGSAWNVPNLNTFKFYDQAIDLYQKEHPETQISYKSGILRKDYSEWLFQQLLRGTEPDIFLILPEDFTILSSIGALCPLDDASLRIPDYSEAYNFYDQIFESGRSRDRLYAFPIEMDPTLIFVNKTLLDREQISPPPADWTWNDLYKKCLQVTKDTDGNGIIDQFGISGFDWEQAVYSNQRMLFTDQGKRANLTDPGVIEAFEFASKLDKLNKGTDIPDFDDGNVAFAVLPYSFYRSYGYYPYSIQKFGSFDWYATTLPRGPSGNNAGELKTLYIGISARSSMKKEAKSFLKYITNNRQMQLAYLEMSRGLPVQKGILETTNTGISSISYTGAQVPVVSDEVIISSIENAIVVPHFQKYETAVQMIHNRMEPIPTNSSRLQNLLAKLNIDLNEFLSQ